MFYDLLPMVNLNKKNVVNLSFKLLTELKKEATWHLDEMVGMAGVRERCTRRHAQNVKKNVKSLLNLAETVPYTVRSVFRSAEIVAVHRCYGV